MLGSDYLSQVVPEPGDGTPPAAKVHRTLTSRAARPATSPSFRCWSPSAAAWFSASASPLRSAIAFDSTHRPRSAKARRCRCGAARGLAGVGEGGDRQERPARRAVLTLAPRLSPSCRLGAEPGGSRCPMAGGSWSLVVGVGGHGHAGRQSAAGAGRNRHGAAGDSLPACGRCAAVGGEFGRDVGSGRRCRVVLMGSRVSFGAGDALIPAVGCRGSGDG